MKITKQILLVGSGFTGGFVAGYLASIYSSEQNLERNKRTNKTIQRLKALLKESQLRLNRINQKVQRELSDPIPDLYRATESLTLDESELFDD